MIAMRRNPRDYNCIDYLAMICFISFLGFCLENLFLLFSRGYVDNRNMSLPFLLGYGIAVVGLYFVLGVPNSDNWGLYIGLCFIAVSVGEIILGKAVERTTGIIYWNYESLPFHVTRYTSLFTSIGFTVIIFFFMDKIFIAVMEWIHGSMNNAKTCIVIALTVMLAIDFFTSFGYMFNHGTTYKMWQLHVMPIKLVTTGILK
jgi:uncharacterized membrane protein